MKEGPPSMHPAFCNYVCEKHEIEHQEDVCPLCYHEEESREVCEKHGLWILDDEGCERCEEAYQDELSQRELSQDWTTWNL